MVSGNTSSLTLSEGWRSNCIRQRAQRYAFSFELQSSTLESLLKSSQPVFFLLPQEDYANVNTLETRLQTVAKTMIAKPLGASSGRDEAPNSHGIAGNGFGNGSQPASFQQQPNQMGYPRNAQALLNYSNAQSMGGQQNMLMGGLGGSHQPAMLNMSLGSSAMNTGSGNLGWGGNRAVPNYAAGLAMSSPAVPKVESSLKGGMGMNLAQQVAQQSGALQRPRNGLPSSGPGPVMSNGAPVLLRGSRDQWLPGQPTGMVSALRALCRVN